MTGLLVGALAVVLATLTAVIKGRSEEPEPAPVPVKTQSGKSPDGARRAATRP